MHKGGILTYMLTDHLGSTSLMTNASGVVISETRYTPWGEVRYQAGTTSTGYTYTGQYSNTADFGLMYYTARWYDPSLGRFAQADSIVPAGVQGLDRYSYTFNNPLKYTDPSGHDPWGSDPDFYYAEASLYVDAGIYQQSWGFGPLFNAGPDGLFRGYYDSKGSGKITDAQMNNPYGSDICPTDNCGEENHGLGLGLFGLDQHEDTIARLGISRRIDYGLGHVCLADCTAADKMMVAALAANSDLNASNYRAIKNALQKFYNNSPNGEFDWEGFIENGGVFSSAQQKHLLADNGSLAPFLYDFEEAHPEIDLSSLDWIPEFK